MRYLYILGVAAFGLNLACASYNIIVYLVGKRRGSNLVYVFYTLVVLQCLIHIVTYIILAVTPSKSYVIYDDSVNYTPIIILECIG